jgi:hypothetical protein
VSIQYHEDVAGEGLFSVGWRPTKHTIKSPIKCRHLISTLLHAGCNATASTAFLKPNNHHLQLYLESQPQSRKKGVSKLCVTNIILEHPLLYTEQVHISIFKQR